MANKTYDESSIEIHQGLEGCRKRPHMYIGELGAQGIQHLLREIVENSIDEFFEKQNSYIVVKVINNEDKTQTFIVGDKGRGIPVGKHKTGLNTLTAIMTILHAGGKFDDTAYKSSRGVNGVGISIVNALSRKCEVWTNRNNDWYYQSFEKGIATIDDPEYMESKPSIARNLSLNKGTIIKFTPDYKILSKDKKDIVKLESLEKWLYTVAFLNSGVKIKLIYNDKEIDYYNSEGPQAFVKEILPKDTEEIGKCFVIDNENLTVALQWTDYDEEDKLISYVSGAETESGGTHLVGLMDGLARSFKNYSNKASALTTQDIKLGIVGFINYRLSQSEFDSQKKDKLITVAAKKDVSDQVYKAFSKWLNNNKATATIIVNRALDLKNARLQAKQLQSAASKIKNKKGKIMLPGKLTQSTTKDPTLRELFIVEGDSAAGCWIGSTKVRLINGESKTFEQLVEDYENGIINYGYAHSNKDSKIRVVPLKEPRIVKFTKKLCKITLDNGREEICTREHLWKLRTGEYMEAYNLVVGDSLMPHIEEVTDRRWIKHPTTKGLWEPVYKIVGRCSPKLRKQKELLVGIKENLHHKDLNKLNDHPKNLEYMVEKDHRILHAKLTSSYANFKEGDENWHAIEMKTNKKYRKEVIKRSQRLSKEFWFGENSDKHRKDQSKRISSYFSDPSARLKTKKATDIAMYRKYMRLCKSFKFKNKKEFKINFAIAERKFLEENNQKRLGFKYQYWFYYYNSYESFVESLKNYTEESIVPYKLRDNHKVTKVELITLENKVPVYDIEVDKFHNYALNSGVYVHNSARKARYPEYQEVLAIRGKILNVAKTTLSKALSNEEVQSVLTASGIDLKETQEKNYRVGKILFLCDADEDGKNIEVLLSTLFQTLAPELYDKKMIYVVDSPLYFATYKEKQYSGFTFDEIRSKLPKSAPDNIILRMKGWGECSHIILKDLAFNPKTRKLINITPLKTKKEKQRFIDVVGNDTNTRKELLGVS